MSKRSVVALVGLFFLLGIVVGGYLFHSSRPRSFIALNNCQGTCLNSNELMGLLTSVGMQRFTGLAPKVVKETDKTIVIEHPQPLARLHYLVIPKKDFKNVADLDETGRDYLVDAFAVMGKIIREKNLVNYRVTTNGPGYQTMTYLHFHLMAD
jgi:histidine triad (HIT) family protein